MRRGTLVLVVGPSGAGKDSLIEGARMLLAGDPGFAFPRRLITRPREAGGEDHVAITADEFAAQRDSALLSWEAHGLGYAVPAEAEALLGAGASVVVNVSRRVIVLARQHLSPVLVIEVAAPPELLARRLAARGRESEAQIKERLESVVISDPEGSDVVRIVNDGSLDDAVAAFVQALRGTRL